MTMGVRGMPRINKIKAIRGENVRRMMPCPKLSIGTAPTR